MRDLEKNVYNFYKELAEIHAKSFPDMRPGQFLLNALGSIQYEQGVDPFFPEADALIDRIKFYANNASPYYRGWEVLKKYEQRRNSDG